MKMQLWSSEFKTELRVVLIAMPAIVVMLCWPTHPYSSLSLGLCIGLLLSSLVPPRMTIGSLVGSLLLAASSGPLYFLCHNFIGGWFAHTP